MRKTSGVNSLSTLLFIILILLISVVPGSLLSAQEETPFVEAPIAAPPSQEQPVIGLPTEEPPVTEQPTVEDPVEIATEAPVIPTEATEPPAQAAVLLQAEPALVPATFDNFDVTLGYWTLGAGWAQAASEGGQALQVVGSSEPAVYGQGNFYDGAVQARFLMNGGAASISVRQSFAGSYTATLDASGSVTLYRLDAVIGEAAAPFNLGQWNTLRLSAIGDVLRVAVNGLEVLAVQDVGGLPPGVVTISGSPNAQLLVDDFVLWLPQESISSVVVPTLPPVVEAPVVLALPDNSVATMGGNGRGNGNGNGNGNTFQIFNGHVNVKVLTVVMAENGELTGDFPGEAQHWIEGEGLYRVVPNPGGFSPAYCNRNDHCLIITGVGFSNAASSIMAAGLNPKLDLSRAYILIAGIAGVDPADGTLASAAWVDWVVDGDLAHHIDARELPAGFEYSMFRLNCYTSQYCPDGRTWGSEVYQINTQLVNWAYHLTQNMTLNDSANAQATRANYPSNLPAGQPPSVIRCDSLGSSTYWHGQRLSNWANWWVSNWTGGAGNYCMTNQEDAASMTALRRLANAGLLDYNRVFILRTASNFDQPYAGQPIINSLSSISGGYLPSLLNAYLVGSTVTDHIITNWHQWRNGVPPLP